MMKNNTFRNFLLSVPSMFWLMLFFAVPVLFVLFLAFKPSDIYGGIGDGWTLETWKALANPSYPAIFWRTIYLALLSTAISVFLAVPICYQLARMKPKTRQIMLMLIIIPFWTNFLIRIYAWKVFLHPEGIFKKTLIFLGIATPETSLLYNQWAVLTVMVYTYLPFAILPIYAVAEKFDFNLMNAAKDLGATSFQAFRKVFLPGISKGIGTSIMVVLIPALGAYLIPDLVGGPTSELLGDKIAQRVFTDRNLPHASMLSSLLMLIVFLPLGLFFLLKRKNVKTEAVYRERNRIVSSVLEFSGNVLDRMAYPFERLFSFGRSRAVRHNRVPMTVLICVLIFFYAPLLVVIAASFNHSKYGGTWGGFSFRWYTTLFSDRRIWDAFSNSLMIGIAATLGATILGTLAALAFTRFKGKYKVFQSAMLYSPLVVPDILMGISMLLFFTTLIQLAGEKLFVLTGLRLELGYTTIIIAHITFCVSYVAMIVSGRLQDFDRSLTEAAADLGANGFQTFRKVTFPLIFPAVMAGALFAFTLSIDDFVITFFVNGAGVTTLPILIQSLLRRGSPAVINALSVVFLIATFILVFVTQKLMRKKEK